MRFDLTRLQVLQIRLFELDCLVSILVSGLTLRYVLKHRNMSWVGVAWEMMIQVLSLTICGNLALIAQIQLLANMLTWLGTLAGCLTSLICVSFTILSFK